MRRSVVLLSMVFLAVITVLTPFAWSADSLSLITVDGQKTVLTASAGLDKVRYFTLDTPKRLVVDLYGVQPGPHSKNFALSKGFKSLRVGPYEDKTRFVFDVSGDVFPTFNVNTEDDQVVVTWQSPQMVKQQVNQEPATVGSSQVTGIDFSSAAGKSTLQISLNRDAVATTPERTGNKIQFSLQNATLPRALRRIFDTLSFPSAIHSVSPYLVNKAGQPEVRFVVTLKGDVPYALEKNATGYSFIVNDGQFASAASPVTGVQPVPVEGKMLSMEKLPSVKSVDETRIAGPSATSVPVIDQVAADDVLYTGAKTSLVFDNADVRDILRLIAEISDLNIIASDEVEGNVTLRLIDVPWDQALELILDITDLGMLPEGNVVRVLPKDKIRSMKEAELTAVRSQEKLEDLVTEVVTVSYAALGAVSVPAKELLSERGSITEDSRNKLLIVTDISSRIEKVRELIAILDTPERQVMIEARIVQVNSNYSRELGVHWGVFGQDTRTGTPSFQSLTSAGGNFLVDITEGSLGPITPPMGFASQIQIGRALIDDVVLDLQLQAMQTDGKGKVISTPRVTTLNGETALISQGTTIPYQTSGADGPKTEFVNAELKLEVTPVINPDNSIILEILATNDSPGLTAGASAPSIDTKKAQTKVMIKDGQTTVIGGIFVENEQDTQEGVPGLMHVPILGNLFKTVKKQTVKDELLIFITPRIMHDE